MRTAERFAILVASCDRYSDMWEPFFTLFARFWPDCPYPVYLLSNTLGSPRPEIRTLRSGPDSAWSDCLGRGLEALWADYVFLWLDDLFLCRPVNSEELAERFDWLAGQGGHCLRLNGVPRPDRRLEPTFGVVSPGTLYRTSTVLSMWRKQTLLDLLVPGESAWQFEIAGSVRSDAYDGFYATYGPRLEVVNTVIKGKWDRSALARVRRLGVEPDLSRRPVMTRREQFALALGRLQTGGLNRLPARWRRRVREWALGARGTYAPAGGAPTAAPPPELPNHAPGN